MRTPQEEANLKLVLDMFEAVLNPMDSAAVDRFIAPNYIQHNQSVEPGVASIYHHVPFKQDDLRTNSPWPACEHAPGAMRVLKLETLTIRGRTTYMTRGGTADVANAPSKPHVHVAASDLKRLPTPISSLARR